MKRTAHSLMTALAAAFMTAGMAMSAFLLR